MPVNHFLHRVAPWVVLMAPGSTPTFVGRLFERPFLTDFYLIIVKNYKTIIIPNNSRNPAHPIAVAQAKLQPKEQM